MIATDFILDFDQLLEICDNDSSFVEELLKDFVDEVNEALGNINLNA
jgi:hypothetical protein